MKFGAEKIQKTAAALGFRPDFLEKVASRDIFDARELLRRDDIDRAKLRLAFVVYGGLNRKDWRLDEGLLLELNLVSSGEVGALVRAGQFEPRAAGHARAIDRDAGVRAAHIPQFGTVHTVRVWM